jgi:peptidoglycan/LPS O-acetylase OafA/YrhL
LYLPLPDATALGYAAPLLTVVFAALILGEKVRLFRYSMVGLGLCGVLIVLWPNLGHAASEGAALGAALLGLALLLHPHFVFLLGPVWLGSGEWLALRYDPAIWLVHNTSLGAGIVLLGIVGDGWRWSPFRLLCVAPLRVVGRISYGLYLYHLPIYWAVLHGRPTPIATVQAIALSFLAAGFSFWAIERPLLRYAARFRRAPVPNA